MSKIYFLVSFNTTRCRSAACVQDDLLLLFRFFYIYIYYRFLAKCIVYTGWRGGEGLREKAVATYRHYYSYCFFFFYLIIRVMKKKKKIVFIKLQKKYQCIA